MSDQRTFRNLSGRLITSSTDRLFEPVGWRTDSLGLPRDTKKFEGLQATTSQGVIRPTYFRALTGNSVTASAGSVSPQALYPWGIDTFTDTDGTLLNTTPHTSDSGYSWSSSYGGTGSEPSILTNRLRGAGSASGLYLGYLNGPTVYPGQYYVTATLFRYATTSGVAAGQVSEGIMFRYDGIDNFYEFGWCEQDDTWYLNRSNFLSYTNLGSSVTGKFTGVSQSRTLKIYVYTTATSVEITCWVDGVQVIQVSDTSGSRIDGVSGEAAGITLNNSASVDFDSWEGDEVLLVLSPQTLTVAQGALTPDWYPVPGAKLVGRSATAAGGSLSIGGGGSASASLTGQGVTTAQGTMGWYFGIGTPDPATTLHPINPKFTLTKHSYGSGDWYRPSNMLYPMLSADGKLKSSGWEYLPTFTPDGTRMGRIQFNQTSGLWEGFGSNSTDEMYADDGATIYNWPRNGYPTYVPPRPSGFNDFGPTFSNVDPLGNVHTGTIRYRDDYYTVNGLLTSLGRPRLVMFGWQSTDITVGGGRYLGPELTENVQSFYPYHPEKVIAFYTRAQASPVTGRKCNTYQGLLYPVVDYGAGTMQLQGLRTTVTQGALLRDTSEPGGVYSVPLLGNKITAEFAPYHPVNLIDGRPVVINPTQSTFVGFRNCTITSTGWGPEVSLGLPTGLTCVLASNIVCVVPTGVPDLVFAVYGATGAASSSATAYSYYACVATINTRTLAVTSHIAQALSAPGGATKLLGDVVQQASGQNYAQLHFGSCALHMAWTGSGPPTLTEKAYPVSGGSEYFIPGMSTFELRSDMGFQMIPLRDAASSLTGKFYLSRAYYNSITSTSAVWTRADVALVGTPDSTAGGDSFMAGRNGKVFLGSGGGLPSMFFQSDFYNSAFLGPTYTSYWTWNDFWNAQDAFFSVSAVGRVGTVSVNFTPNVQLTGLRAEAQINPFDLVAGGPHRDKLLRGRRATVSRGVLAPPSFNFFFDTYNNSSTELLEVHTSDSGHSYTTYQVGRLNSAGSILIPVTAGVGGNAIANVQPPTPNYRVSAHLFSGGITQPANTPTVGIVARADNVYLTQGYLFGHNRAYDYAFLLKLGQTGGPVIAAGPAPGTALYEIEVNGQYPTHVTCRIDGVVWYEYDDYGTDFEGPYTGVGYVGVRFVGLGAGLSTTGAIGDINAAYYDPGLVVLTGQRATTGFYTNNFGLPGGAGLIGNAATATAGVLEGGFGLSGLSVTTTGGHLYPEINLTGLAATATGGTLYTYAAALTGLSITATRGFFAGFPAIRQLIGQRVYATPGLVALLNRELLGLRATIIRGDVIFTVDAYPTLLGYMLATSRGLLVPQDAKASTGNVATATIGTLGAVTSAGATLTGLTATATRGTLGYTNVTTVVPTGLRANTAQGSLAPSAANDTTLAGRTATATVGTILSTVTVAAVGAQAVSSQGVGIPLLVLTPQGRLAVTAAGTMQMLTNIALTGRSCTLSRGTMTDAHGCTLYPTGVAATGLVGSARFNPLAPGIELFVQADPDELRAADEPDELVAGP